MISSTKDYTIVVVKAGPNGNLPGVEKIIWEHGEGTSPSENVVYYPLFAPFPMEAI